MKLIVTTNARLYKTADGAFWARMVYGYLFFQRYLRVFDEVILVAHCEESEDVDTVNCLRVDGPGLIVYEVPFPHGKIEYIKKYFKIRQTLKKIVKCCDAAILRIPDQLAFQLYSLLKKRNIPVAVEITSNSWEFFSPESLKGFFRPFLRVLWHVNQKHVCKTALGVSYVTKYALQKRYPPMKAIKGQGFTSHYTDTDISLKNIMPPRTYDKEKKLFTAIHVCGNIGGYAKGHKELIEAMGILSERNIHIDLVLVGTGKLAADIEEQIDKYKLRNRIRFTGMISDREALFAEMRSADIFVFPSYREGLPRVVVEAMACALPCVTTDLDGIRELLDDNCMVPVRDSDSLADKLQEVFTQPDILSEMSRQNSQKAREYCKEETNKKRREFYEKLKEYVDKGGGKK